MQDALFVGIDIGTQGTKGVLCDSFGHVLQEAFCPSKLYRPDSLTVYEDPEDIFSSVCQVLRRLTSWAGEQSLRIRGLGMDSQMAGIMGIKEDFAAATPLDSWLDTRCAPYTELLRKEAGDLAIQKSGGQIIHAHASKILWWKGERQDAYRQIRKFVQPNGYVAGRLCGLKAEEAFMDYTFLHFNNFTENETCGYNEDMLRHFQVAEDKMPAIVSPEKVVGTIAPEYARQCGLPAGVEVIAGCGDTAASSLGAGITEPGQALDVAGTASVFSCCTDRFAPDTSHKTILFARSVCEGLYLPLAYISGGGLCLEWYAALTGCSLKKLDELIRPEEKADTPVFLPHFTGRTCPLDNRVSGAFLQLEQKMGRMELYRSILESISFEYRSYLEILRSNDCLRGTISVKGVGGGAKSPVFSQIKSDVLGLCYRVPGKVDSAPTAMALLAAHALGERRESLTELFRTDGADERVYWPKEGLRDHYEVQYERYVRFLEGYGAYATN